MHDWLLYTVILPTIKAMAELCEKHGISFVCHIEHKPEGKPVNASLTFNIQSDATDEMRNTLSAAQGKLKNKEKK